MLRRRLARRLLDLLATESSYGGPGAEEVDWYCEILDCWMAE